MKHFNEAQLVLSSNRTITLPKPDDLLWIVTYGEVRTPGIGVTLYVTRGDKLDLADFFSANLRGSQVSWLPCKIETLSIATATEHFSSYITQSHNNACILTDRKPASFLLVVSRFQASLGRNARNAPPCQDVTAKFAPLYTVSKSLLFDKLLFRTFSTAPVHLG